MLLWQNLFMSFYPPEVGQRFHSARYAGKLPDADAVGTRATFVCGAVLRFALAIDKTSKEITNAKFQTDGCGFVIAAADVLAEKIIGKKLIELHGAGESGLQVQIENELGAFPPGRRHCLNLAAETLQAAFNDFRATQLEEWNGEKALICTCFGVSEDVIENLVAEKSLPTVEAVTVACNAGGGCGACRILIQEIIDTRHL